MHSKIVLMLWVKAPLATTRALIREQKNTYAPERLFNLAAASSGVASNLFLVPKPT